MLHVDLVKVTIKLIFMKNKNTVSKVHGKNSGAEYNTKIQIS